MCQPSAAFSGKEDAFWKGNRGVRVREVQACQGTSGALHGFGNCKTLGCALPYRANLIFLQGQQRERKGARKGTPHPDLVDSLAPARSARKGPLPPANFLCRFPSGTSPFWKGEGNAACVFERFQRKLRIARGLGMWYAIGAKSVDQSPTCALFPMCIFR